MITPFQNFSKKERFNDLIDSVQHCDICPRLCNRRRVLSSANGSVDSRVLFVAEAPGRLGADRTGIPLYGDRTGDNFEVLLGNINWQRKDIFITNAILCNPKQDNGNNATPTQEEIANCSAYLEMVITLVNPAVIVTLGATALGALNLLSPHGIDLSSGVAQMVPWRNMRLFPLYHPGPRAIMHRSLLKQRADFMLLSKRVHPIKGLIKRNNTKAKALRLFPVGASTMQQVARVLLDLCGQMTYFKMTKLMYFIDLLSIERFGQPVASNIYLRQVEGPWPPDLDKELKAMQNHDVRRFFMRHIPMVAPGPSPRVEVKLGEDILDAISEVFMKYGSMTNAQIKSAVYRTAPMRFILAEESKGKKMLNKPVLYKDKTAPELFESDH